MLVPAHQQFYCLLDKNLGHFRRYTKNLLRNKIKKAGFKIVSEDYLNPISGIGWFINGKILRKGVIDTKLIKIFNLLIDLFKDLLLITPQKLYIGLSNNKNMIFSIVTMSKKIILYSKESYNNISNEYKDNLKIRNVDNIGHYCNHLPSEISINNDCNFELLKKYILTTIDKLGGKKENVDNSNVLNIEGNDE